ncbi:MAG: hypothetical protein GY714_00580 [Desulfobacterales bacterium]|nr:hypothetical protein [Desulfobacterales bacterium]
MAGQIRNTAGKMRKPVDKGVNSAVRWVTEKGRMLWGKTYGIKNIKRKNRSKKETTRINKVESGLQALKIEAKKNDTDNDGALTLKQAERTASIVKKTNPIFKRVDVVDGGNTWDYEYVASPAKIEKGPKKAKKSANDLYNDIRNSNTDVANIAKYYKLKPKRLQNIKNYLYDNKEKNFTPHKRTAEAWIRLSKGKGTIHDKLLLKHETAEMYYNDWIKKNPEMYKQKYEPLDSHDLANEKYDWESGL